jgi:hypothetical protein
MKAGGGHQHPPSSAPGLSPSDMVALLAARQAAESEAAAAVVKSEAGLSPPPPPAGGHKSPSASSAAAATSPRGALSAESQGEDFCCILCGLKEASVDKLKDHINMHFIGGCAWKMNCMIGKFWYLFSVSINQGWGACLHSAAN